MLATLGEVMLELKPTNDTQYTLGVAGDTYNAAVMLSGLGVNVTYATGLGIDKHSAKIRSHLANFNICDTAIVNVPNATPGLYMITNSADGERTFDYWRDNSAAKQVFQSKTLFSALLSAITHCQHLYWSGITLSLLSEDNRQVLFDWIEDLRHRGGTVFFDSNYRSTLWNGQKNPTQAYLGAIEHCDYFLPSNEDIVSLWPTLSRNTTPEFIATLPCQHAILTGEEVASWITNTATQSIKLDFADKIVDATGAGDAFSGAFCAGILQQKSVVEAIKQAHSLASKVVQQSGALLNQNDWSLLHSTN